MKAAWQIKPFEECIEKVAYTSKIQRKDFLTEGAYPIVSQEEAFINGYWDDEADLFEVTTPLVIFGDHTKVLKYVDFDFVLGADGVKLLQPREFLEPKFFYYQLQAANLDSLGYARHYRLLKELAVGYPSRIGQQRIVAILDEAFAGIATAKANAEKNLQKARELFNGRLASLFAGFQDNRMLGEICQTSAGGTPLSSKKEYYEKGLIPWIMSGEVDRKEISAATKFITQSGLENSSAKLFPENTVLVAMYGATAGQVGILRIRAATNQAVCGVLPNEKFLPEFLYFLFLDRKELLVSQAAGNAQPNISQAKIRTLGVPCPSLEDQESVVVELDKMTRELERLESLYARKLVALDELKQSLLQRAFSGQLS